MGAHDGDAPQPGLDIGAKDVIMPVVPMFHVNAWGLPFSTTAAGAKHVYPGPSPTPEDLATLIEEEGVTMTAGVPTVWLGLLEYLDEHDVDLSSLERLIVGGSAAPEAMIRFFDDRDVELVRAGADRTAPVGAVASLRSDQRTLTTRRTGQALETGTITPGRSRVTRQRRRGPDNGDDFGELAHPTGRG